MSRLHVSASTDNPQGNRYKNKIIADSIKDVTYSICIDVIDNDRYYITDLSYTTDKYYLQQFF
jgi:hypothetical protein